MQNDLSATDFSCLCWKKSKQCLELSILREVFNNHAPMISKPVKGKISQWLNPQIKSKMNNRDKLYRKFRKSRTESNSKSYKSQRNKVNVLVRKAKKEYFQNLLRESTNDPSRFWKILKKIFPTKNIVSGAKSFLIEGSLTTCPVKIASAVFASFLPTWQTYCQTKIDLLE